MDEFFVFSFFRTILIEQRDPPSKPLSSIVSNREVGPEVNHSGSSSTLLSLLRRGFQFLLLARSNIPF